MIKTGIVEGTGALLTVTVGFDPSWVQLYNIDGDAMLTYTQEMDTAGTNAAVGLKTVAAGTTAFISTGGVAKADGVRGFTIGIDADVNVIGENICWIAGY